MGTKVGGELELTDEMVGRLDEIDNATYGYVLMLAEKTEDELVWDMEVIEAVTSAVKEVLWTRFQLKVRHPAIDTEEDGSQSYSEYDYGG